MSQNRHWTAQEDAAVVRYVKARPQNLHKCFIMVAEQIDRTPAAVANHWYTKLSKNPDNLCFFTASSRHISKNRKSGDGAEINHSIWRRLVNIIRGIH